MKLTIAVENTESITEVKSVSEMWKTVKELFAAHGDSARIVVTDENGNPFKDLTIQIKSNGKKWMMNAVKETNRKQKTKKNEEDQEAHSIDEAPKKDKKKKRGTIIAA